MRIDAARHLSEWQEWLAFRSVDITCQIWPTRRYTRSWYTKTSLLKKRLQAPTPFLSQFPPMLFLCLLLLNFFTWLYISGSLEQAKVCSIWKSVQIACDHNFTWVVFPDPVSPTRTKTWCSFIPSINFSLYSHTGSSILFFSMSKYLSVNSFPL